MAELRAKLPPDMPRAMRQLPRDDVGRPVPFFVEWVPNDRGDTKPDFRIMNARNFVRAIKEGLCWVCGEPIRRSHPQVFVAGPMCLVNGTSAEPPCHTDCADWSARACPFLSQPKKVRREANLPEDWAESAGIALKRNPGVTALITAGHWRPFKVDTDMGVGGWLIEFWAVRRVEWIAEGRTATPAEIAASLETGLPTLYEMAVNQSAEAVAALELKVAQALRWVPS